MHVTIGGACNSSLADLIPESPVHTVVIQLSASTETPSDSTAGLTSFRAAG